MEPHLWQDPKWQTFYVVWYDGKGTRHRTALKPPNSKRGVKDQPTANRLLAAFKRDLLLGKIKTIVPGSQIRLYDFVDEFMRHKEGRQQPESTLRLYRDALNKAKAVWKDVPMGHIRAKHFDDYITGLSLAGLKEPTVNKNYRHLKHAIKKAIIWGYTPPILEFPSPLSEAEQIRYLTRPEFVRLLDVLADDPLFYDFCMFSAYGGLRSGEILRLMMADLDNPVGFIRIVSKQKNRREDRTPIGEFLRVVVDRCIARGVKKIFPWKTETWISQKFKAAIRSADLRDEIRFHDLRHTFASHLAMGDKSDKAVQGLLRHRSSASTQKYMKLSNAYLAEAVSDFSMGPVPAPRAKRRIKVSHNSDK
ncbi:MAG: site-specific integrase [Desulfobacterales bacterium]|nr:site-specific integrase [Desulfobacterales bacterium]